MSKYISVGNVSICKAELFTLPDDEKSEILNAMFGHDGADMIEHIRYAYPFNEEEVDESEVELEEEPEDDEECPPTLRMTNAVCDGCAMGTCGKDGEPCGR